MTPLQEVFTELDWDEPDIARRKRDDRLVELQAKGLVCVPEDLYRIDDGRRVFLLTATPPSAMEPSDDDDRSMVPESSRKTQGRHRPKRRPEGEPGKRDRSVPPFETR